MRYTGKRYDQDDAAHKIFAFAMDARNISRGNVPEVCVHCGGHLQVYYCEEKLCLVRCLNCGVAALVQANSLSDAARKTIGR